MSGSQLMDTEAGGESGQYEGDTGLIREHKKSGGQMGHVETTSDPTQTSDSAEHNAARGEQTAANIRYGQAISETGMGGKTTGLSGQAEQQGYGQPAAQKTDSSLHEDDRESEHARQVEGYGGKADMDRNVGA